MATLRRVKINSQETFINRKNFSKKEGSTKVSHGFSLKKIDRGSKASMLRQTLSTVGERGLQNFDLL